MSAFRLSCLKYIFSADTKKKEPHSYGSLNILKPYLSRIRGKIVLAVIIALIVIAYTISIQGYFRFIY